MFRGKTVGTIAFALVLLCSVQMADAINFSQGYDAFSFKNVRTGETRSAISQYGYQTEPVGDFARQASQLAKSAGKGWLIFGEWRVENAYSCYDDDGHGNSTGLPRCDDQVIENVKKSVQLQFHDVSLVSWILYFALPLLAWGALWGILTIPLTFLPFYPVAAVIWHLGFRKLSKPLLTVVLCPFFYLAMRYGIPNFWLMIGNAWSFIFGVMYVWFFLAFFGALWMMVETLIRYSSSGHGKSMGKPFWIRAALVYLAYLPLSSQVARFITLHRAYEDVVVYFVWLIPVLVIAGFWYKKKFETERTQPSE